MEVEVINILSDLLINVKSTIFVLMIWKEMCDELQFEVFILSNKNIYLSREAHPQQSSITDIFRLFREKIKSLDDI